MRRCRETEDGERPAGLAGFLFLGGKATAKAFNTESTENTEDTEEGEGVERSVCWADPIASAVGYGVAPLSGFVEANGKTEGFRVGYGSSGG